MKTALGRFRIVAFTEGISYLLLLLIGMPFKYLAGIPEPVKYLGWAHGVLFILFIITLINVMFELKWSLIKGIIAMIASVVPFGTFVLDSRLLKEEAEKTDLK
jgi:integral membrane protein